jgi:DNA polymerase/3'-5' exonuclease PolX
MDTFPLSKARFIAYRSLQLLSPHCHLIEVAGSIRREQPQVKDIEIICLPKKEFVKTDLFGGGFETNSLQFVATLESITSKRLKGSWNDGRYVKSILKGDFPLDLFMPVPEDYYRQLAIRTGSSSYSHNVIARAWLRKGWCGSDKGLRKVADCQQTPHGWKCLNENGEKPPQWISEKDFFDWLGIKYLEPKFREVNNG